MRILVCGGRDFSNRGLLWGTLDAMHAKEPITLVVNGAAPGADKMSTMWAAAKDNVAIHEHPARWTLHGKAAGPIRNSHMLTENVDVVVAFPGGYGTADMVRKARAKGVPVIEVVTGVDDGGTR
jgi:hypothetical protein